MQISVVVFLTHFLLCFLADLRQRLVFISDSLKTKTGLIFWGNGLKLAPHSHACDYLRENHYHYVQGCIRDKTTSENKTVQDNTSM